MLQNKKNVFLFPGFVTTFQTHLVCELGGAHDLHDVERSPADIVAQHLKL